MMEVWVCYDRNIDHKGEALRKEALQVLLYCFCGWKRTRTNNGQHDDAERFVFPSSFEDQIASSYERTGTQQKKGGAH